MEKLLAVVENGKVTRVLVVDPNDAATIAHFGGLLLPEGSTVGIGHDYDGATFKATPVIAPAPTLEDAKRKRLAEIEVARDAACVVEVSASGRAWQANERNQKLLTHHARAWELRAEIAAATTIEQVNAVVWR